MMNTNKAFITALSSLQSRGELKNEKDLFGQFVGEWKFDWYGYEPGTEAQQEKGEWIFSWILEGRAIQDVWIIPTRNRRGSEGIPKGEYGTTIRFYNEKLDVWQVVWVGPIKNRLNIFEARKINNEIVLEESNNEKFKMKWIFSNITENSFNWRSITSKDNGNTWKMVQEMKAIRKTNNY